MADDRGPQRRSPPAEPEVARALTESIRDAMSNLCRAVGVLARRVRAARQARVWLVLGYGTGPDTGERRIVSGVECKRARDGFWVAAKPVEEWNHEDWAVCSQNNRAGRDPEAAAEYRRILAAERESQGG